MLEKILVQKNSSTGEILEARWKELTNFGKYV
jgi:hypothetical protein